MSNSFVRPTEKNQSGATTPGQSVPRSDGNERVLHIPQSLRTTGAWPSNCLVSYPGHSLGESNPSPEKLLVIYCPSRVSYNCFEKGIFISFEHKNKRKLIYHMNFEAKFSSEIRVECTTLTMY